MTTSTELFEDVERVITAPIYNPATGAKSKTFTFAGKVDLIKDRKIIDWKTVTDPARFIQQSQLSYQAELYALALMKTENIMLDGIEYRLIQRPSIKLCNKDGLDVDKYAQPCIEWLNGTPGSVQTHHVFFNESRIEDSQQWLWSITQRLLDARNHGRYLYNEMACFNRYGSECAYLPLCLCCSLGGDVDDIIREQYQTVESHEELPDIENKKDILTFSSAKNFCECEKKYLWRNVHNLKKRTEEDGEAIRVGTLTHAGLERFSQTRDFSETRKFMESQLPVALSPDDAQKVDQMFGKAWAMVSVATNKTDWF